MPELAEVAYFARQWEAGAGERVASVFLHANSRVFRDCNPAALETALVGERLQRCLTHGKQMLFSFSGGHWLRVHAGMSGSLSVKAPSHEPEKHDHLVLLTRRRALVFNDPRQFGGVSLLAAAGLPETWVALPVQPMEADFTRVYLTRQLARHRTAPLKAVLLDQSVFPGIGNWMADEVMWRMRLHPETPTGTLTEAQFSELRKVIREVCRGALATIGVHGGDPPAGWLFHDRWEKNRPCPRCGTLLVKHDVRGRTACWCPQCQPGER